MRVVAGEFKGRHLIGPKGDAARPTSDKVREAIFSIVGPIDGLNVLDLFAGTGALGIEALSRGAEQVTFVERDRNMRAVIQSNLQVVAGDRHDGVHVQPGDALTHLAHAAKVGARYDLVLVDPPYADAEKLAPKLAAALPGVLAPGATVVAECDRRAPLKLESTAQAHGQAAVTLLSERKYGDTLVQILTASET